MTPGTSRPRGAGARPGRRHPRRPATRTWSPGRCRRRSVAPWSFALRSVDLDGPHRLPRLGDLGGLHPVAGHQGGADALDDLLERVGVADAGVEGEVAVLEAPE